MKAETKPSVIPAQAGIQFVDPGFRVSRCSPGMTGYCERPGWIEDFVSEQHGKESLFPAAPAQRFFTPLRPIQNDTSCLWGVQKRSSCPCAVYVLDARHQERGFTLLEIMVACAILGLVVAALYGVFSHTLASKRLAEERMANVRAARIALWRIGEDLQASFPLTGSLSFLGETRREGEFPQDSLSFVSAAQTLLTSRGAEGALCQIGYTLMPDPRVPMQQQLVRRVQIDVRADQDASGEVAALLSHVRGLRFRFFDGQNWLEEWGTDKTQNILPQAVEVTLYLNGSDMQVAVFSTVVTLPLAGSRRFGVS